MHTILPGTISGNKNLPANNLLFLRACFPGCIIGSHSHVVAPFEWIDGVPVFYSMGNLISSQIGIDRRT